jgi:hypothetical protein
MVIFNLLLLLNVKQFVVIINLQAKLHKVGILFLEVNLQWKKRDQVSIRLNTLIFYIMMKYYQNKQHKTKDINLVQQ